MTTKTKEGISEISATDLSKAFKLKANKAQFYGADWSLQVDRLNGITLEEAQAHALNNDSITYFFRVKDGATMVLEGHGTFNSGDTVFFAGNPWYGSAMNLADSYEKNAASVNHVVPQGTYFTKLVGKIKVPESKPQKGLLFLWPGLQPGNSSNNQGDAIGNGVLQPVLTYPATMRSCAPNPTNVPDGQWWISGQYVNTDPTPSTPSKFKGCHGGDRLALSPGDVVNITMEYDSAAGNWTQTCECNGNSVTYTIALEINGEVQNQSWLLFINEPYGGATIEGAISMFDLTFTTNTQCDELKQYLENQPQVVGVDTGASNNEITVDRIVFHSPINNS
ncbi:MAG: hypothetical protein FH748_03570 [Balneolaceae bacterium]|nr:hypothetical protein [Balneolaceae bacterium]